MAKNEAKDQHHPASSDLGTFPVGNNGELSSLLTVPTEHSATLRSRSNSNRIIRSAVRTANSSALNKASSPQSCHYSRFNESKKHVEMGTTAAIMPTVRKLSECAISNQHHLHATSSCSSLLPLHEPKMIRLDREEFHQRRCLSSHSVQNASYCGFDLRSGGAFVKFSRESTTVSALTVQTNGFTSSFISNELAMKFSSSGSDSASCHLASLATGGNIRPTDLAFNAPEPLQFTSAIVVNPKMMTPEADKSSQLLMTTQLSNTSSGVSSMFDDELRRSSISSQSVRNLAAVRGADDSNDDLFDDLINIIQRDTCVDMKDEQHALRTESAAEIIWRNRRASSDLSEQPSPTADETVANVFLPDAVDDRRAQGCDEFNYKPANIRGFNNDHSLVACDAASRACWPTTAKPSEPMLITELQPAAPNIVQVQSFESVTCNNNVHSTTAATSITNSSGMDVVMPYHVHNIDGGGGGNENVQMAGDAIHHVAAVSTPEAMQMMSDNELMRMWIESLPPPHQLPEPTLSPRLPVVVVQNFAANTTDSVPVEITSRSLHSCADHDHTGRHRYTLVLDLDETLVHAVTQPLADVSTPPDLTFPIEIIDPIAAAAAAGGAGGFHPSPLLISSNGVDVGQQQNNMIVRANILVYVRPYAVEFLREMAQHYEVVVFTASKSEYADRVIDYLCDQASSSVSNKSVSSVNGTSDREDESNDDDDAGSTSSTATTPSPCSSTISSHASSGYASSSSTKSTPVSSQTSSTITVVAAESKKKISANDAANLLFSGTDEVDCTTALRCTESILNDDMPLGSVVMPSSSGFTPSTAPIQLPALPPHKQTDGCVVKHRLYREHCVQLPFCPIYLKDLSRLGRSIERTVIVDNQLLNFALQMDNGIAVRSWHGSPDHDDELRVLSKVLLQMAEEQVADVRPFIKKSFGHLKP